MTRRSRFPRSSRRRTRRAEKLPVSFEPVRTLHCVDALTLRRLACLAARLLIFRPRHASGLERNSWHSFARVRSRRTGRVCVSRLGKRCAGLQPGWHGLPGVRLRIEWLCGHWRHKRSGRDGRHSWQLWERRHRWHSWGIGDGRDRGNVRNRRGSGHCWRSRHGGDEWIDGRNRRVRAIPGRILRVDYDGQRNPLRASTSGWVLSRRLWELQ